MVQENYLRKFVAPEFIYGSGARLLAGRYAKNLAAKKVLIVTDPEVMNLNILVELEGVLIEQGLEYEIYSSISPNSRDEEVMNGSEVFNSEECNLIIALGGGSPMDCAKGIGIVSSNRNHILEFEGVDQVPLPSPPLICIPTTAGTSADVSQFAIILDSIKKVKIAIISKTMVPDVALIDPFTTLTMDKTLTAHTGFDALVHSFEAYVSNASSHITNLHALDSIRLISSHILPTITDLQNQQFRSKMMLGSLEAGLAFSNASLGLIHAMAHSLGGLLDLSHGKSNAILMEHVIDYNFSEVPEKYLKIARAMGIDQNGLSLGEKKDSLLNFIKNLKKEAGVDTSLKKLGVREEDFQSLALKALQDPCIVTNPRRPSAEDIEEIYQNAF
ncbi:MAG: iron-containing alcohol dehydrogenase [Euryarchaeota archaeon]|nr:iron-containing alcohol dehydrogenase [Euryarchaeota archaeon]MBU4608883.1 iron-containing alcohol dehydrogenase [Euryarchaeota archaeon]MBV1730441.1 iron-containing alcohol dehydrogenase [Methanobacterium sp.]MBV1754614.1 iron-containing alcohol dehydrogenase [Methanobacterium sp.]